LGGTWGRKVHHNLPEKRISSGQPLLHDALKKLLGDQLLLVVLQHDLQVLAHVFPLGVSLLVLHVVDNAINHLLDGFQDELNETTFELSGGKAANKGLLGSIKKVVTPKLAHHLLGVDAKLCGVHHGEFLRVKAHWCRPEPKHTVPA
jgi:hypothetical protein